MCHACFSSKKDYIHSNTHKAKLAYSFSLIDGTLSKRTFSVLNTPHIHTQPNQTPCSTKQKHSVLAQFGMQKSNDRKWFLVTTSILYRNNFHAQTIFLYARKRIALCMYSIMKCCSNHTCILIHSRKKMK